MRLTSGAAVPHHWRAAARSALDDVVELLNGLAATLMRLGARLEEIYLLVGGDDEEADS